MIQKETKGWLTGKFCMLHMGHIHLINQAATLCDELTVVVSQNDKRFSDPRLALPKRIHWLKTIYKDLPHVKITFVNETDVPEYPNGWQQWSDLIKGKIGTDFDFIFSSETGDEENYNKYFPNQKVVLVDPTRSHVNISATKIRSDLTQNWGMMPSVVRKDFLMKVCIIGTESCGKSTLTKMLAKHYQTSWVEEYGRTFCEQDLCGDEGLLTLHDYGTIAARRWEMEQEASRTANRVLFCDTSALSTNYFCVLYERTTNDLVSEYENLENYDLILWLDSDVKWVDDGLRKNPDREHTDSLFSYCVQEYKCRHPKAKIEKISGNYNQRLTKAIELVDNMLQQPIVLV